MLENGPLLDSRELQSTDLIALWHCMSMQRERIIMPCVAYVTAAFLSETGRSNSHMKGCGQVTITACFLFILAHCLSHCLPEHLEEGITSRGKRVQPCYAGIQ